MKRNKLWYLSKEQRLYPCLSTDSPFHKIEQLKLDATRNSGSSTVQLNDKAEHYILAELETETKDLSDYQVLKYEPLKKIESNAQLQSTLQQFGLNTSKKLPDERLFLFRMLNLKALVWTRVNSQIKLIDKPIVVERNQADNIVHNDEILSEIIVRQAESIAARALYAFGLDVGSVILAISGTGSIAVRQVFSLEDVVTRQDEAAIKKAMRFWHQNQALQTYRDDFTQINYVANIKRNKKSNPLILMGISKSNSKQRKAKEENYHIDIEGEKVKKYVPFLYNKFPELLIGADPEFIFVNEQDEIVPAVDVLKDDPFGSYGIDTVISNKQLTFPVAEIRPNPQETPQELFNEIESILQEVYENGVDNDYVWLAGGMPKGLLSLGGHIHFSGIALSSDLLRILDCFVGIPFSLTENVSILEERRQKRYGALGDFRRQEHGGFEYRTMSSWLVSPAATKAALALAFLVVNEHKTLKKIWKYEPQFIEDYHRNNIEAVRYYSLYLLDLLEQLPSYSKYGESILPLKNMLISRYYWDESTDIKKFWQLYVHS